MSHRPTSSWRFVVATAVVAATLRIVGCGVDPVVEDPTEGFDTDALFANIGAEVIHPTLVAFAEEVDVLGEAVATWEGALALSDGSAERIAAQGAWRDAMAVWQQLEVMQIGPAGAPSKAIGGAALRDAVYSWPTVNACRVDQETLEEVWDAVGFFEDELVNVRGLDALEHILWSEESVSRCPNGVSILENGDWAAAEVQPLRADYAMALVGNVGAVADQLLEVWAADGGDWGGSLASYGDGSSLYEDRLDSLNALFHALFYMETVVKDRKLAQPLGLRDCDQESFCPGAVESQFADAGLDHLAANLQGALALLTGGDGSGFDDLLIHAGREDLAVAAIEALDATVTAVDAVDGTALEAIEANPAQLMAVHDALKSFTDLLKGDFAVTLLLDIPGEAATDTD